MSHAHVLLGRCITLAYWSCSSITPVRAHQKLIFGNFPPFSSRQTQQLTYHTHHKSGIGITSNPDHPPLSRHCVSDHVLCAVALPIVIVAVVACSPPSFYVVPVGRHRPLCRRHHCHRPCRHHHRPLRRPPVSSLSPNSDTHLQQWWHQGQLGGGGSSLAAAKAVGRRRRRRRRSGSVSAAAALLLWQR